MRRTESECNIWQPLPGFGDELPGGGGSMLSLRVRGASMEKVSWGGGGGWAARGEGWRGDGGLPMPGKGPAVGIVPFPRHPHSQRGRRELAARATALPPWARQCSDDPVRPALPCGGTARQRHGSLCHPPTVLTARSFGKKQGANGPRSSLPLLAFGGERIAGRWRGASLGYTAFVENERRSYAVVWRGASLGYTRRAACGPARAAVVWRGASLGYTSSSSGCCQGSAVVWRGASLGYTRRRQGLAVGDAVVWRGASLGYT